jgi:hypothetical protein
MRDESVKGFCGLKLLFMFGWSKGPGLFMLELTVGRSQTLPPAGLCSCDVWGSVLSIIPAPRLVLRSGSPAIFGRNWVTGRRLNRGATVGVEGRGRIAALSAKGLMGPLIFSSSSNMRFFSIFFLRWLYANQARTNIAKIPASTPMAIPAFAAVFPSPLSVAGWAVAEARVVVVVDWSMRALVAVASAVVFVVWGASARVVSVLLITSSGGTKAVGSVALVVVAWSGMPLANIVVSAASVELVVLTVVVLVAVLAVVVLAAAVVFLVELDVVFAEFLLLVVTVLVVTVVDVSSSPAKAFPKALVIESHTSLGLRWCASGTLPVYIVNRLWNVNSPSSTA